MPEEPPRDGLLQALPRLDELLQVAAGEVLEHEEDLRRPLAQLDEANEVRVAEVA